MHCHYGHITISSLNNFHLESLKKSNNYCIIQDFSFENIELPFLKNEIGFAKINATRTLKNKIKTVTYNIEGEFSLNKSNLKLPAFDAAINFIIYSVKVFFKIKRILGNIKRFLKR